MTSTQTTVVYKNDTFRNLIRRYSNERMQRDSQYREAVEQAMQSRRDAKQKAEAK